MSVILDFLSFMHYVTTCIFYPGGEGGGQVVLVRLRFFLVFYTAPDVQHDLECESNRTLVSDS